METYNGCFNENLWINGCKKGCKKVKVTYCVICHLIV